jgi:carboxylesterase
VCPEPAQARASVALGDGPRRVLLIHGLTGTPAEVRPIADALHSGGFAVRAPLLAGHDDPEHLAASDWRDWHASAEAVLRDLASRGPIAVVGFSMGALLALRLAAIHRSHVAGVASISVFLELPTWQARLARGLAALHRDPWYRRFVGHFPKRAVDVRIFARSQHSPSLRVFPYAAIAALADLQRDVRARLAHITAPLLLLHGRYDHTAPPADSERVAQAVSSASVRRVVLPRSFHIVGNDLDREEVCREVVGFARAVLGGSVGPHDRPDPRR